MSSGDDQHLNLRASTAAQDSGWEDKLKNDSQPNGAEATLDGLGEIRRSRLLRTCPYIIT